MNVVFSAEKRNKDVEWFSLTREDNRECGKFEKKGFTFGGSGEARVPVVGAGTAAAAAAPTSILAATANPKMPRALPTRRGLQALALVLATAYATILLYQAVAPRQWPEETLVEVNSASVVIEVPAAQRTMMTEEIAVTPPVATATMAPFSTDLDDVFISVKTTKHYHRARLPAIIGTWFQFAKDQIHQTPNLWIPISHFFSGEFSAVSSNFLGKDSLRGS